MAEAADLALRVLRGDVRAVARAISIVEDGAAGASELRRALYAASGQALVVGITGPAGAGKSTLVDALTAHLRRDKRRVGIVAVDPTSPYSGGAILGDRIRMQTHAADSGVFIRSMATRGHVGGLAAATQRVVTVLAASGNDVVLVETVGVGQDETEIFQGLAIGFGILTAAVAFVGCLMYRDSRRLRPRATPVAVRGSAPAPNAAQVSRIGKIVRLARTALDASAVLYSEVDEAAKQAVLRDADASGSLIDGASISLGADPFASVAERRRSFYITDFKGLLWDLPYHDRETKVGTLLAVPVFVGDTLRGVLIAEKVETQAFTGAEPGLLEGFGAVVADSLDDRRPRGPSS